MLLSLFLIKGESKWRPLARPGLHNEQAYQPGWANTQILALKQFTRGTVPKQRRWMGTLGASLLNSFPHASTEA